MKNINKGEKKLKKGRLFAIIINMINININITRLENINNMEEEDKNEIRKIKS